MLDAPWLRWHKLHPYPLDGFPGRFPVERVLHHTIRRFHPAESFRLAFETATSSPQERERARSAEVLYQTLRKAWVPDLCRAVAASRANGLREERKEVRDVLRRALGTDLGHDAAAWLAFWDANQHRYRDE